jgi:hypothetical protein
MSENTFWSLGSGNLSPHRLIPMQARPTAQAHSVFEIPTPHKSRMEFSMMFWIETS